MRIFRYLDFKVYKDSKNFYRKIIKITERFIRSNPELVSQLRRAVLSICLNIAEGSAKRSDKDFNRYLENSLGSVSESIAALDCAKELNLITEQEFKEFMTFAEEIANQLGGFSKKLRS